MTDLPSLFASLSPPPAARLLGWTFKGVAEDGAHITVGFHAGEDFTNPQGHVQGGLLAAMLDDTMGPAVLAKSGGQLFGATIDLHTQFIRPVVPGDITCEASVVNLGRSVALMEGRLFDHAGALCTKATASARIMPWPGT